MGGWIDNGKGGPMEPETRAILQCLYAPRAPLLDEETGQPKKTPLPEDEVLAAGLTKQAMLAVASDGPENLKSLLELVEGAFPHRQNLDSAARALYSEEPGGAPSFLIDVPVEEVAEFSRAVLTARKYLGSPVLAAEGGSDQLQGQPSGKNGSGNLERQAALLSVLESSAMVDPIGFLHLERLHFTPVRYRRGDLAYAVTLLPGELLRLTHREWSRTDREFTSLVAESMENEQEESVSEKSELTESSSAQRSHSMAFSASMSVSGQYGIMHFSANAGLQVNEQTTSTRESSRRQTREVTRKASSRAKKEHKVTFRVASAYETESTSYRELRNDSTEAVRWDFHRMMKEWRVQLYRYDIRLTYDVTLPEPGSYLLRFYRELEMLNELIDQPMTMPQVSEVTPANYEALQQAYGVLLEPPPSPHAMHASATTVWPERNDVQVTNTITLNIPDGYEIDPSSLVADLPVEAWRGHRDGSPDVRTSRTEMLEGANRTRATGAPLTGVFLWRFTVYWWNFPVQGAQSVATVRYVVRPLPATTSAWRARAHAGLIEALRARWDERTERLTKQRDELAQRLADLDALHLRRLEREELMKGVLRWVLGPTFRFYPNTVLPRLSALSGELTDAGVDERRRGLYNADGGVVDGEVWQNTLKYGQLINFLHQAIEWENVNFVLYPYFWTDQNRWHFKQALRHLDDKHLEFLRAGAARVVMTIRPGFETAWLRLAATGELALSDEGGSSPYLRIADQIKLAAQTYQPHTEGTQRLDEPGLLIDEWTEWTPTGALDVARGGDLEP